MKKLIAAVVVAFASLSAHAQSYMVAETNIGTVVLSDAPCLADGKPIKNFRQSAVKNVNSNYGGCWAIGEDGSVVAVWDVNGRAFITNHNPKVFKTFGGV